MKFLLFLFSFLTVSLCQNLIDQIREALSAVNPDPDAPYTSFPFEMQWWSHLILSPTEFVLNPRLIRGVNDIAQNDDTLLYVRTPVKLEVFERLQELGAGPKDLLSFLSWLNANNFAYNRLELVENGLVQPEEMWADAIDSGDAQLLSYLLRDVGADRSHRILCQLMEDGTGDVSFSLTGYCIFKGQIELLKILLSAGVPPFNPPVAVLQEGGRWNPGTFKDVNDFDEPLAAAFQEYAEREKFEWAPSEYSIVDLLTDFSSGKVPLKTVELLLRHGAPSRSPLQMAINYGPRESVLPLIRSGTVDLDNCISLLLCAKRNFAEEISELLERGFELKIESTAITSAKLLRMFRKRMQPEHYILAARHLIRTEMAVPEDFLWDSIEYNQLDLFLFLLELGVDPHHKRSVRYDGSYTALGWSVILERIEFVRTMLSHPSVDLDAPHYWNMNGESLNFWDLLMVRPRFFATVLVDRPTLLDAFVKSVMMRDTDALVESVFMRESPYLPSFMPEFLVLLRKRVSDPDFPLEAYKQTNADGWSILDLVAFHPYATSVEFDTDLIKTLLDAGIPTKFPLTLTLLHFYPLDLLPLISDPSIDLNERMPRWSTFKGHILVLLLEMGVERVQEIVELIRRGAKLDAEEGDLIDAHDVLKRQTEETLVKLLDELSRLLDSGNGTETCNELIQIIATILSERHLHK